MVNSYNNNWINNNQQNHKLKSLKFKKNVQKYHIDIE